MDHTRPPARPPRQPVLILAHADGWVEAFGNRNIDIHIAMAPAMDSPEGRIAAEAYLDNTLPHRYRGLYVPGNLRAADLLREVHPSDIADRNWRLSMLNVLDRVGSTSDDGGELWIV